MICDVQLNKAVDSVQRLVLPRPIEQSVQQRAAVVDSLARKDEAWQQWSQPVGRWLSIAATVLDKLQPAVLQPEQRIWTLHISLSAQDYEDLSPGPEVGLRFIATIEQVLADLASKLETPPPTRLTRTKRELEWLGQGGIDPGPGARTSVRVRRPPRPMPEPRFWTLIAGTVDDRSGAFRLSWHQADRFAARMRLLCATLDTPAHREAAQAVLGFVSDDVWEDVRAWAVAQGETAYRQVAADPGSIRARLASLTSQDELSIGEALLEGTD
ncbi:DUF4240 domain-containing protein [Pedococcus bigeumensis]|uniref:DUF4240 domain-containing protein n=1 Tax=Pedococcus bigeumensis TaxID=433644 RepID=UPI002FEDAE3D